MSDAPTATDDAEEEVAHGELIEQDAGGGQDGAGSQEAVQEPGRATALLEAAVGAHGDRAWVRTRDELVAEGWFGPRVGSDALARLGDVALVAKGTVAFTEPTDTGPYHLIGRHGSLTADEMLVPFLAATA